MKTCRRFKADRTESLLTRAGENNDGEDEDGDPSVHDLQRALASTLPFSRENSPDAGDNDDERHKNRPRDSCSQGSDGDSLHQRAAEPEYAHDSGEDEVTAGGRLGEAIRGAIFANQIQTINQIGDPSRQHER